MWCVHTTTIFNSKLNGFIQIQTSHTHSTRAKHYYRKNRTVPSFMVRFTIFRVYLITHLFHLSFHLFFFLFDVAFFFCDAKFHERNNAKYKSAACDLYRHWTVSLWVISHKKTKYFEDNIQKEQHIVQSALREQKSIRCVKAEMIRHFVKIFMKKKRIAKYCTIILSLTLDSLDTLYINMILMSSC